MRQYYHFGEVYTRNGLWSDFAELRRVEKKFYEFTCKYAFDRRSFRISFIWGGFVRGVYVYQENGTFYEFFSGYCIGEGELTEYGLLELSKTNIAGYREFRSVKRMTASQFASDVEPYMWHKNKIGSIMREYFGLLHEIMIAEREMEQKRNARDTHDASWLESFLNKR